MTLEELEKGTNIKINEEVYSLIPEIIDKLKIPEELTKEEFWKLTSFNLMYPEITRKIKLKKRNRGKI